jgi:hypothetical protein
MTVTLQFMMMRCTSVAFVCTKHYTLSMCYYIQSQLRINTLEKEIDVFVKQRNRIYMRVY